MGCKIYVINLDTLLPGWFVGKDKKGFCCNSFFTMQSRHAMCKLFDFCSIFARYSLPPPRRRTHLDRIEWIHPWFIIVGLAFWLVWTISSQGVACYVKVLLWNGPMVKADPFFALLIPCDVWASLEARKMRAIKGKSSALHASNLFIYSLITSKMCCMHAGSVQGPRNRNDSEFSICCLHT